MNITLETMLELLVLDNDANSIIENNTSLLEQEKTHENHSVHGFY